ncbi:MULTISPECIES: Ig-like domain repeat protein, partial [unclassified Oceanispirochaeta]|uniref:beta strand repeat-containing protein n=1 Tax=unclassified Oceanispirochaeta TaxID=2635722 RepID=UPI000E13CBFE
MKKYLILTATIALTLLFVSCPEPLTEDIVTSAQDSIAPVIEIYSPSGNAEYLSVVEFEIQIKDDAENENDEKGDISTVEFSVSNDDFRGGRILISPDGIVTQDEEGGSDLINYDPETGLASFSISTIEPNILSGLISVTITATDRNSNSSQESITLFENEGPWFELSITDEDDKSNRYLASEFLWISCKIGNSSSDKLSSSEIISIEWSLADSIIGTLFLDKTTSYVDSYSGETLTYYDTAEGVYKRSIDGFASEDYVTDNIFDPVTNTLTAVVRVNDNLEDKGSILFNLTIEDQNGHEVEETVYITENKIGPNITPSSVDDGIYGYFSDNGNADIITGGMIEDEDDLSEFVFKLTNGTSGTDYEEITSGVTAVGVTFDTVVNGETVDFAIDIESHLTTLLADVDYDPLEETYIDIKATATNGVSTSLRRLLEEDSTAPDISSVSFESSNDEYPFYSKETHDLTLRFSANDLISEDDDLNIETSIGGIPQTNIATDSGDYEFISDNWSGGSDSDEYVPVIVIVSDRLDNSSTYVSKNYDSPPAGYTEFVQNVMYYSGAPTVSFTVTGNNSSNSLFAKDDTTVSVAASSSRDLVTPTISINTNSVDLEEAGSIKSYSKTQLISSLAVEPTQDTTISFASTVYDRAGNDLSVSDSSITYDNDAPEISYLTLTFTDTDTIVTDGVVVDGLTTYINSYANDTDTDISLSVNDGSGGTSLLDLDDNFRGYQYTFGSFTGSETSADDINADSIDYSTYSADALEGSNSLTLRVYDEAGNFDDTSIIFTLDTVAPIINVTEFTTPGTTYTAYAKENEKVELDFTIVEAVSGIDTSGSFVKINNSTESPTTYFGDGTSMTSDYNTTGVAGSNDYIDFEISILDKAGNSSITIDDEADLDSDGYRDASTKNVMYYSGAPIVSFTVTGNNSSNSLFAKDDTTVSVAASSSRDLSVPTVLIATNSVDLEEAGSIKSYSKTQLISSLAVEPTQDTTISFTSTVYDRAGNDLSVSDSSITYDNDVPEISYLTLAFTDTDTIVTDGIVVDGLTTYINSYANDTDTDISLNVDDGNPGIDTLDDLDDNYRGYQYTIGSFSGSGLSADDLSANSLDYTDYKTDTSQGSNTLTLRVYDEAGNFNETSINFTLDTVAPIINVTEFTTPDTTFTAYAKENEKVELDFTIVEAVSGIDTSGSFVKINNSTESPTTYFGDGTSMTSDYTTTGVAGSDDYIDFEISILDKAGNSNISRDDESDLDSDGYRDASTKNVMYYSGAPIVSFTVTGNNSSNSLFAKDDTTVSVAASSSRDLSVPTVLIATNSVDLEEAGSIKSYSKTQLISSLAVEPTQDTTISFTSTVYDRA